MLKKSITYKNFNDEEVTEDFYFNLSQAEIVEMEASHKGGLSDALERIVKEQDNKAIVEEFKTIIMKAYGKRSDDGRRFIKNDEIREEFASTEAYSVLFMEMFNEETAAEFINGIVPQNMGNANQEELAVDRPNLAPDTRVLTQQEVIDMDREELKSGLAEGRYALS